MVKKMKSKLLFFLILLVIAVSMGSCTYTLRYTISSSQNDGFQFPNRDKTFAVESKTGLNKKDASIESDLLQIVSRTLTDMGWKLAGEGDAEYIFNVNFEIEEYDLDKEFGFGASFGSRSGLFLFGGISKGMSDYSRQSISITARLPSKEKTYSWNAETTTRRVNQKITTLARHIIPTALSHFPEEGYWEIKEKVRLHEKTKD